jgi:hypothetical protein
MTHSNDTVAEAWCIMFVMLEKAMTSTFYEIYKTKANIVP